VGTSAAITFTDGRSALAIPESITVAGIPGDGPGVVDHMLVYRTIGLTMWYVPLNSVLSIVFNMERPKRSRLRRKKFSQVGPKQVPIPIDKAPDPS
jgi:hypothetical protein